MISQEIDYEYLVNVIDECDISKLHDNYPIDEYIKTQILIKYRSTTVDSLSCGDWQKISAVLLTLSKKYKELKDKETLWWKEHMLSSASSILRCNWYRR